MYIKANIYEIIVDNEQTIQYISDELRLLVLEHGSVKMINSIATVVLTVEDDVVMAAFSARILDQLIAEPISTDSLDVALLRTMADDAGTICERTQAYARIETEIKKRRNELIKLSSTTPIDKALIDALDKTFAMIEMAKSDVVNSNNVFFVAK